MARKSKKSKSTDGDEFAPCRFAEIDGEYFLNFDDFESNRADSVFEDEGFDGGGYGWEGVVRALVKMRKLKLGRKLSYDPEASLFSVHSKDRDILLQVAGLIREAITDPILLREAISKADPDIMEG